MNEVDFNKLKNEAYQKLKFFYSQKKYAGDNAIALAYMNSRNEFVNLQFNHQLTDEQFTAIQDFLRYESENDPRLNLPAKVSFFDRVKNRLRIFFGVKHEEENSQNSGTNSVVPHTRPENNFDKSIRVNPDQLSPITMVKRKPMVNPERGIIIVSDLHGNINQWKIIKEYMQNNPNKQIYILGDAIDRGDYGVDILCEIMELSKQGKVTYIPGNHDAFTYNAFEALEVHRETELFYEDDIKTLLLNDPKQKTIKQLKALRS